MAKATDIAQEAGSATRALGRVPDPAENSTMRNPLHFTRRNLAENSTTTQEADGWRSYEIICGLWDRKSPLRAIEWGPAARETAFACMERDLKGLFSPSTVRTSRQRFPKFHEDVILELERVPSEKMMTDWIRTSHPERLRELAPVLRYLARTRVDRMSPGAVHVPWVVRNALSGMAAASAIVVADVLDDPDAIVPYEKAGLLELGERILRRTARENGKENHVDREKATDAVARLLGIEGWYEWGRFDVVARQSVRRTQSFGQSSG